jgi:hypothetical protein
VITVEKVHYRRSEASNMYWPHIWWNIQADKRGVDFNERCIYAALIIYGIGGSAAESNLLL